jgi:hypothetical protein
MTELLLAWTGHLLGAFHTHGISMRFGELGILIFAVWIFGISNAVLLDII